MNNAQWLERWRQEEQQPFTGWDFSYLDGRMLQEQPPWSYAARAAALMDGAVSCVDLGTGGGEYLLSLRDRWPSRVAATEGYPPNRRLASERLSPMGVQVIADPVRNDSPLPFADGEFELVLNRHAAFNPNEVARVLAGGGTFLTQQVHGRTLADLQQAFDAAPQWPDATLEWYVSKLITSGLTITDTRECRTHLTFKDIGALVYYLKAVPWILAGFSVNSHAQHLLQLQAQLDRDGELTFAARTYLIEAFKNVKPVA